ncbi:hypothetical protein ACOMHN_026121 [Nucella lapillus]
MEPVQEFRILSDSSIVTSNTSVTHSHQTFNDEPLGDVPPNGTIPFAPISEPVCQWILYYDINKSKVRVWDVMILVPNALFLLFLLWHLKPNIRKLRASTSPMFSAFYGLVIVVSFVSLLRCVVSMTVKASGEAVNIADRILWLTLRFFLLSTEASVITFGFYFGYLDSKTSIQRVLACSSFFALAYSAVQGTLEMKYEHKHYNVAQADNSTENFDLFAHGGMIFLSTSSAFFCLIYFIILIMPLTKIREKLILPSKPSFYYYVAFLAVLNLVQAVGGLLLYQEIDHALCIVDTTTYMYFILFDPLVYVTFLWKFLRSPQSSSSLLFSYSHQDDDVSHDGHLTPSPHSAPLSINEEESHLGVATFDRRAKFSTTVSASPPSRLPTPFLSINQGD